MRNRWSSCPLIPMWDSILSSAMCETLSQSKIAWVSSQSDYPEFISICIFNFVLNCYIEWMIFVNQWRAAFFTSALIDAVFSMSRMVRPENWYLKLAKKNYRKFLNKFLSSYYHYIGLNSETALSHYISLFFSFIHRYYTYSNTLKYLNYSNQIGL